MGAWGVGILENDLSYQVWDFILTAQQSGLSFHRSLRACHERYFGDEDPPIESNTNYWWGIAQAMIDSDSYEQEIASLVGFMRQENIDLDLWLGKQVQQQRRTIERDCFEKLKSLQTHSFEPDITANHSFRYLPAPRSGFAKPAYFQGRSQLHAEWLATIDGKITKEDGTRLQVFLRYRKFVLRFELLLLEYSKGAPIEKLKIDFINLISDLQEYNAVLPGEAIYFSSKDHYYISIWLMAVAYLLGIETVHIYQLIDLIGNHGEDRLYDQLVHFVVGKPVIAETVIYPESTKFLTILPDVKAEQRMPVIRHYLNAWYASLQDTRFYQSHYNEDGPIFLGYWAFELAAFVKYLQLNDRFFADHEIYPRDLTGQKLFRTWEDSEQGMADRLEFAMINDR